MVNHLLILSCGLAVLILGAHLVVTGGSALALILRVTPAVIALTVIATGTSLPELFISGSAAYRGLGELAVGNLIGSNLMNIALVLGLSSLFIPIAIDKRSAKIDWPMMFGATLLSLFFLWDLHLQQNEGLILMGVMGAVLIAQFFSGRKKPTAELKGEEEELQSLQKSIEEKSKAKVLGKYLLYIAAGFVCLQIGARVFVIAAKEISLELGISERIIGLTIAAFGTSLPELMTSIWATMKKKSEIAIGNIMGSNIFNIVGILGVCGALRPFNVSRSTLIYDFPVLLGLCILFLGFLLTGEKLSRGKGLVLLLIYGVYTISLFY